MTANITDAWTLITIAGLALVTVVTRCFFLYSSKSWQLPNWVSRGLHYAPIAALSAVILPEILITNGQFLQGHSLGFWQDAKLIAGLAGAAVYFWRKSVLLTMSLGMLVYLPLHLWLGW
jgi:branched-subunit amino acid transport protein